MNTLIDKMCLRRLCLPSNTNIDDLRSGAVKNNRCECGTSHHIACVLQGRESCFKGSFIWNKHV